MKKLLLSLATVALTATAAQANETTITFDGDGDIAGLTRITGTAKPTADQCVKSFSLTEGDLTCSFSSDLEMKDESINQMQQSTGAGFALYTCTNPAKPTDCGLYISSFINTEISLAVPGGKITGVTLKMSGWGMGALNVFFNNDRIETEGSENGLYPWIWNSEEGEENVTVKFLRTFDARYLHSIQVTYTPDLQGKKECGLSFNTKSLEVVMDEEITYPVLSNPNNLPVSWSSSNDEIATVDANGKVTLLAGGKVTITAATEGNAEFAAGNAKYELTVIPVADNILQMKAFAPVLYDRVKVNFPMTVTFANLGYAFVIDPEGNAGYIYNNKYEGSTTGSAMTIYKIGDIIPASWLATNATIYESVMWQGQPGDVTEHTDVTYPYVDAITVADTDRVLILRNVTFETATPYDTTKAYGTTPDGTRYEFQDTFNTPIKPAGTYDVTGVVRYAVVGSQEYFYMAPLAYADATPEVDPGFPESFEVTLSNPMPTVEQIELNGQFYAIMVRGECPEDTITVTLGVPQGWDGFLAATDEDLQDDQTRADGENSEWVSVDTMIEEGYKKINALTFAVDGEAHTAKFYLYKGDQANQTTISVKVEVKKYDSGISAVEAENSEARYFNLQGVEIENPEEGIFIKVTDGKTLKITKK